MQEIATLIDRIDREFQAVEEKKRQFQQRQAEEYVARKQRLEEFGKEAERLREVILPRLETLSARFGDNVKVTPTIEPAHREVVFAFRSELASVRLKFSLSTDEDVRHVIFDYNLEILPIFIRFTPHDRLQMPLDKIDDAAVAAWLDDRLVDFVRTYLSLYQNERYWNDHLVIDPIAKVRFPDFAAACTLERAGQRYWFISEQTKEEFLRQAPNK